ncbi:MAG TPA: M23 family metallopeptidase [Leptospiraceae bacterium]|nr:M23 family metallopeptidase [Leptospiraceae bacterium]
MARTPEKKKKPAKKAPAKQVDDFMPEPQPPRPTRWQQFRTRFEEIRERIHKKGRERITIMVIPHTEKQIFNLHVNLYAVVTAVAVVTVVLGVSILTLAGKSGEDIQNYDMGLTNSQFNVQTTRMAEEMVPLHNLIQTYSNTIAELYFKLDGDAPGEAQGGAASAVLGQEIESLRSLVEECKKLGEDCDQGRTEEILRRVIFLSRQDNQNLRRAVELSDKILAQLKTKEKRNLLKNTPSIWPVKGYVLSAYGWQVDSLRGRKVFRPGMEIGALPGSEVVATAPGIVERVDYTPELGLHMWVSHRFGMQTLYAHLDRVVVPKDEKVQKGQLIAYSGKTGMTSVPMLYYEVHVGTVAYNPYAFLNHIQDEWLNPKNL